MTDGETASDAQNEGKNTHNSPSLDNQEPHINGNNIEDGGTEEPPAKRRRVSESLPMPRKKPESPPWKRVVAEGPSSFTLDGMRKSGRTNAIPLELQPQTDKRQTRGAQRSHSLKSKPATTNGYTPLTKPRDVTIPSSSKRPASSSAQPSSKSPAKPATSPKRSHRKSMPNEPTSTPVRSHKKSSTLKHPQSVTSPVKSKRTGRAGQGENGDDLVRPQMSGVEELIGQSPKNALSRIKFRVKPAALPYTHAGLIRSRPRQFPTLKEYLDKSSNIHVEEGGLFHPEEGWDYTPEVVLQDAKLLLRMEKAAEGRGVLSPGVCSVYRAEDPTPIPRHYAHQDHMITAAIGFRKLMNIEQRKHRANAKRLAEACKEEWLRRQPKSLEQLEAEEAKAYQARYKFLVKALQNTWENVRVEVNRRRLLEWEAQEQIRVRKALNEAVDISTQKLQARRAHVDSEAPSDEDDSEGEDDEDMDQNKDRNDDQEINSVDGDGAGSDATSADRESNMSGSESEADDDHGSPLAEDENLTMEQLQEKYKHLQNVNSEPMSGQDRYLEKNGTINSDLAEALDRDTLMTAMLGADGHSAPDPEPAGDGDGENIDEMLDDSDESVDMDDDLGSSDEERGTSDEESSEEDEEGDESDHPAERSLLGFLPASDIQSIQEIAPIFPSKPPFEYDEEDMDEVSLIPDTAQAVDDEEGDKIESPVVTADNNALKSAADISLLPTQTTEVPVTSPDRSSQPTLRTTETRPTDSSASSVDHQPSRQITRSVTPELSNQLKTPVPFLLRGTLREYQHYGLDWLAGLYANNTNGILADEMGLGKTIQTIALLAHLACEHQVWGPHLVIVPTSVMLNWEMEFKKWCPGFKILTYYGNQDERKRKRQGWKDDDHWNVCITSYQIILADQQVFKRRQWHYMILDEAHNIKNFQSQRWQTMLTFNTRARLLLTGTPLQNNLTELWSLLYFLMPSDGTEQGVGGFADLKQFQDWFKKPSEQILEHGRETMDDDSRAIIAKLHKVLRPYLLRRLKADVEKQMPAKYEHVEWCRLSKRQRELYDGFLSRDETRGTLASGNYLSIINCLMQLRKVCNHPDLFIERAIMTSFPMEKSAIADFEVKDLLLRRRLLREDPMSTVSLEFLNLVPTKHEVLSEAVTTRSAMLTASRVLMDMREAQRVRAQNAFTSLDTTTAKSNLVYLEGASRWGRFEELQHCVYLNALRRQQKPIYGTKLVELLTLGIDDRPLKPRPRRREHLINWLEDTSPTLVSMVPSLDQRSKSLTPIIQKFACVTPPVIARDMTSLTLTSKGVETVQNTVESSEIDPYHEARMRLSIQFPDKRLLQYDCGKLQTLAKLLRKLEAGGHRALIFTQMTKVLDILEQFLNIHGHKYLRLDGQTKIEQRQILTDRFNNDTRILAFILSTRSGGLGINLTGADTVIFYDLDWNPAMDKQCQDRCHRIGQTRDVHIYRLVSEHTIEANILRKANQKQMLDDVVIQEGDFTTDYFNKMSVMDVLQDKPDLLDGDEFANAAMNRVLGGVDNNKDMQRVIAQAEDTEDVAAARIAEKEIIQTDAADFDENVVTHDATPAGIGTPRDGVPTSAAEATFSIDEVAMELDGDEDEENAWGERIRSTDDYMLKFMSEMLKDTPVELPKEKSRNRKGRDRSHRAR